MNEIHTCPVCGQESKLAKNRLNAQESVYAVYCTSKRCRLSELPEDEKFWFLTKEQAIENWNDMRGGDATDGSHSWNDLYDHRTTLFASLVNLIQLIDTGQLGIDDTENVWKSKQHEDGSMYDDYFIAGINLPSGPITYHQNLNYWNKFRCGELEHAPEFDGHTPEDVVARLQTTFLDSDNVRSWYSGEE